MIKYRKEEKQAERNNSQETFQMIQSPAPCNKTRIGDEISEGNLDQRCPCGKPAPANTNVCPVEKTLSHLLGIQSHSEKQ